METRLYKAGAVQSVPSMASLVSEGYPTGGNPAQGIAATKPGDAWFYGIGEEIRNVILAAGLTPSNNDLDQLAQAIEILAGKRGFDTGDLKPLTSNTISAGWLLANGAIISRSANSKLTQYAYDNELVRTAEEQAEYEANPATFTGKIYGPGDGSTTIQIPDMRGRSLMGATSSATVGRYQPEQLPNITGQFDPSYNVSYARFPAGAFYTIIPNNLYGNPVERISTNEGVNTAGFSASRNNAIYTDNGKVHPASIALNFIIKT